MAYNAAITVFALKRRFVVLLATPIDSMTEHTSTASTRIGTVLTEELAIEIYKCKLAFNAPSNYAECFQSAEIRKRGKSVPVSVKFGISPKTVRDIWSHRTWAYATYPLWPDDNDEDDLFLKKGSEIPRKGRPGRPKGSRSTLQPRPRKKSLVPESSKECDCSSTPAVVQFIPWCCDHVSSSFNICALCKKGSVQFPEDDIEVQRSNRDPRIEDPFHDDWDHW